MHRLAAAAVVAALPLAAPALPAQPRADSAAVHAAVLDYVEALYEVAPDRIRRSVSPAMAKYGYARDTSGGYRGMAMTYDQLVSLAGRYNASGRVAKDAPKTVTVYDVQDQTASAKLVAHWGTDYLLLAKQDGRWRITHVLWQSPPPPPRR